MINNVTIDDVLAFDGTLNSYQSMATKTAIYPGQGTPKGLAYVALKMNGEAGEFAEHVGKAMRDDGYGAGESDPFAAGNTKSLNELTLDRRTALIKEIGDVLWYCSAACNELGITLESAAKQNLVKLADRAQRNALQGSGDDR